MKKPERDHEYPIDTAFRVRQSWLALERARKAGEIDGPEYDDLRARILAAGKRFGIDADRPPASAYAFSAGCSADRLSGGFK